MRPRMTLEATQWFALAGLTARPASAWGHAVGVCLGWPINQRTEGFDLSWRGNTHVYRFPRGHLTPVLWRVFDVLDVQPVEEAEACDTVFRIGGAERAAPLFAHHIRAALVSLYGAPRAPWDAEWMRAAEAEELEMLMKVYGLPIRLTPHTREEPLAGRGYARQRVPGFIVRQPMWLEQVRAYCGQSRRRVEEMRGRAMLEVEVLKFLGAQPPGVFVELDQACMEGKGAVWTLLRRLLGETVAGGRVRKRGRKGRVA